MSAAPRICLIEDDEIVGEALSDRLQLEGIHCDWYRDGTTAIAGIRQHRYDAVVCDIQLPDSDGEALFARLKNQADTLPPFIFTTAYGSIDRAVRLLKEGAHDFLTKPLDVHVLLETLHKLIALRHPGTIAPELGLGVSREMRQIESLLPRLASRPGSVLITGESGVGKEEVARAIHRLGDPGNDRPFVAVNCGALTESLMEAELFGHVRGAFTGAVRDKKGYFELAHGGTLFLDEIGEMSPAMQVKVLRVLQERQIVRVGSEGTITVDLRLICATHQDLRQMVANGQFREDLYYRIHVIHLHVPPLRERPDDILWLAGKFLAAHAATHHEHRRLLPAAEKALLAYPWPGNVRELKHTIERACVLHAAPLLTPEMLIEDLNDGSSPGPDDSGSLGDYLSTCERRYIESRLMASGWRISDTAASLGIGRKSLWEKMKKLGIEQPR